VDSIYFKVKGNQVLIMAVLGRQEFKADWNIFPIRFLI
jgi:hypothetical protein